MPVKNKRIFSHNALVSKIKNSIKSKVSDKVKKNFSTLDCLMAAFAVFTLKSPSLLQFEKTIKDDKALLENLKSLFKIRNVPSDTYMRESLDLVDPRILRIPFRVLFALLQRTRVLNTFLFMEEYYLISTDGTGSFSSKNISCKSCCTKEHKNGTKTFYHQSYIGALVHPLTKTVVPFPPTAIQNSDGNQKNDCERNAAKRFIEDFRREHPHLKAIIVADGISSNAPFIKILKENNLRYILVCKDNDHEFLIDYFMNSKIKTWEREDKNFIKTYSFLNNAPLNASNEDVRVNVIRYTDFNKKTERTTTWMFVTDFMVNENNIYELIKGGKSRWKIENETFNTLKNQGYNFEHNYGHGNKNLHNVFTTLMLLAFLVDQILQLVNETFQKVRKKIGSKRALFEVMRSYVRCFIFKSLDHLLEFILGPPMIDLRK
jgi:hypothetical protein